MRVSRAAILQQGAAFGIGRGDVRHVRWLSRARSDCYASDTRHARRLSRAGGVADVGHESMLASTISRARLQGSKSDMPTR